MFELVFALTFKVLLIMGLGFIAGKVGLINEELNKKLSALLTDLILPCSVFASSQQAFSVDHAVGLGQSMVIAIVFYAVVMVGMHLLAPAFRIPPARRGVFVMLVAFANVGFLGFSVVEQSVGETGVLYAIIHNSVFQIIFFSYGIYVYSKAEKLSFRSLLGNRMVWIAFVAVGLYLMPFRFPETVIDPFRTVGSMMMPISMLIIGAQISQLTLREVLGEYQAYLVTFLRMLLIPALVFVAVYFLPVSSEVKATAFLLYGLPSASLNVIMGQRYQNEPEFATVSVAQHSILMVVTLPILLMVARLL